MRIAWTALGVAWLIVLAFMLYMASQPLPPLPSQTAPIEIIEEIPRNTHGI